MNSPTSTLDNSNESTKSSQSQDLSSDDGILAKLRRIKIQEDLIIQHVKKHNCEAENSFIKCDLEYKKYLSKLKSSYADIKQVFDDLQCVTNTQDIFQKSDIDDIKKDVIGLDEKIKSFKSFLQRECNILKLTEKGLVEQKNETDGQNFTKKISKISSKTYSDIVPSPVRNIINSPYKYPEVQRFQDFLSHSPKRGGWNEYNHNIFIRLWQKHFQDGEDLDNFQNLDQIDTNLFINDVTDNATGIKQSDVISHMAWYSKFLSLKKRQQMAIEEWRAKHKPNNVVSQASRIQKENEIECPNRLHKTKDTKMITNRKKYKYSFSVGSYNGAADEHGDLIHRPCKSAEQNRNSQVEINDFFEEMEITQNFVSSMKNISPKYGYTRSTKQWNNRCSRSADIKPHFNNTDAIIKLGIPRWRSKMNYDE